MILHGSSFNLTIELTGARRGDRRPYRVRWSEGLTLLLPQDWVYSVSHGSLYSRDYEVIVVDVDPQRSKPESHSGHVSSGFDLESKGLCPERKIDMAGYTASDILGLSEVERNPLAQLGVSNRALLLHVWNKLLDVLLLLPFSSKGLDP